MKSELGPEDTGPCKWLSGGQEASSHLCTRRCTTTEKLLLKAVFPLAKNTVLKQHPAPDLWHTAGPAAIDCSAVHIHVTKLSSHVASLISLHPTIFKINFSPENKVSSNSLLGKKTTNQPKRNQQTTHMHYSKRQQQRKADCKTKSNQSWQLQQCSTNRARTG